MVTLGDTATEPEVPLIVKPVPTQEVASVDDHDNVADDPDEIEVGLAVSVAVGIGADAVTVTVALLADEVPPVPVHVTEYVVVTLGETETEPEVPLAVKPVPVQDVALVEDQVRVEEFPETTEVGLAESVAVGRALTLVRESSIPHPSAPESKLTCHHVYPFAEVGPPMTLPNAPIDCVPLRVPEEDGVARTLILALTCTRSPVANLLVVTVTVVLLGDDVPPAPVHVTEYVVVTLGETETEPEVPLAVKPVPVQDVALVEDQVRVEELPGATEVGDAESVAVAAGTIVTVALLADEVPPVPVHVTEYVVVTLGETETEPEVPLAVKPVPVQDVALVEDQVRVEELPEAMEVGDALRVAVAAGTALVYSYAPTSIAEPDVVRVCDDSG